MFDTPPSSDKLAEIYDVRFPQIIVIYPLVWKHYANPNGTGNGDWFLYHVILE